MGMFINLNGHLGTTYPETGAATWDLIEDYYTSQYSIAKSAGAAVYTTDRENGYTNAIYGKYATAAMFMNDNVFTTMGARPYQTEGVRITTQAATYGLASAADAALLGVNEGDFVGLGATTVQDGKIPASVRMPIGEFREPSKDLPLKFQYGMYLEAIENKDDVIAKKAYLDKIAKNYSDNVDKTLLRPIQTPQPMLDGEETSLNGIARVLSSNAELNRTDVTLTPELISPYGGRRADHGDFYTYRSSGESNLDANVIDAKGANLSFDNLDRLYRSCQVNWADSGAPNNKVFFMSNVAQELLASLGRAQQRYLDTVYVQRSFNGVKTIPGRDLGLCVKSWNNVPIIQSGNMNFDYAKLKVSTTKVGETDLVDLDHNWMAILTPIQLYTVNNPAVTDILQEINVLHMRMELRTDQFIGSGRLVNLADDSA